MVLLSRLAVFVLFLLPSCWALIVGRTDSGPVRLKERAFHPRGWVKGQRAPADHILELRIALPQPSFPVLERHLYEVSDPRHSRYGQHLSKEEVEALVSPHPESIATVDNWLLSHGIDIENVVRTPAKDWVTVRVPVGLAEAMLNTVSVNERIVHILLTYNLTDKGISCVDTRT